VTELEKAKRWLERLLASAERAGGGRPATIPPRWKKRVRKKRKAS
jgi:hypothetical protein